MKDKSWFIYLLKCSDDTLYCGITNNLDARIKKHNTGKGAKYTRARLPVELYKYFAVENRSLAAIVEIKIKKMSRNQKIALRSINGLLP